LFCFIAKRVFIVKTKGLEDLEVPFKMKRLTNWCEDLNRIDINQNYDYLFVAQETLAKYQKSEHVKLKKFASLLEVFAKYK
jgi:type III restriction enzyme